MRLKEVIREAVIDRDGRLHGKSPSPESREPSETVRRTTIENRTRRGDWRSDPVVSTAAWVVGSE